MRTRNELESSSSSSGFVNSPRSRIAKRNDRGCCDQASTLTMFLTIEDYSQDPKYVQGTSFIANEREKRVRSLS